LTVKLKTTDEYRIVTLMLLLQGGTVQIFGNILKKLKLNSGGN